MWMAGRPRPRPSATCAWKAARCSSTRSAMITDVIEDAFKATGYSAADIDWFVPHQANKRIIDGSAHKLGIAPEKVVVTVDRHGNTSAASIPLAWQMRSLTVGSSAAISSFWKPWAGGSPGVRHFCGGERMPEADFGPVWFCALSDHNLWPPR